VGGAKANAWQR